MSEKSRAKVIEHRLHDLLYAVHSLIVALPDAVVELHANEVDRVSMALEALSDQALDALYAGDRPHD